MIIIIAELLPYSGLLNFVAQNEKDLSIYLKNIEYLFNEIRNEEITFFYNNLSTNSNIDDNKLYYKLSSIKKSIIKSDGFRKNILENKLSSNNVLNRKVTILKHLYIDFISRNSPEISKHQLEVNDLYKNINFNFPSHLEKMRFEENQIKRRVSYETLPKLNNENEEKIKYIVTERNKIANEFGFLNFSELSLYNQGFNINDFKKLIIDFEEETRELFKFYFNNEKTKLNMNNVNASDVMYLFAREEYKFANSSLKNTDKLAKVVDFLKVSHILPENSDIRVEFMNNQQPPAITLIKANEIIVLINRNLKDFNLLELTFHEFGHAIHAHLNLDKSFLLQGESTVFSEGIAQTLEMLATSYEFLTKYMGLDEKEYQKAMEIKTKYYLFLMRKLCSDNLTRIQYYESGGKNFNEIKIQNDRKFLFLNRSLTHLAPNEIIGSMNEFTEPSLIGFFIARSLEYKYTRNGRIDLFNFRDDVSNILLKPGNEINWTEKISEILNNKLFIPPNGGLLTWKG